jgi:hypothetical protein
LVVVEQLDQQVFQMQVLQELIQYFQQLHQQVVVKVVHQVMVVVNQEETVDLVVVQVVQLEQEIHLQ